MSKENFTAKDMNRDLAMARQFRGLDSEASNEKDGTQAQQVPVGYVTIALSTQGNLFAPPFVYARSLKTSDMTQLSLLRSDKLPENNIRVIRDVISQDIDPSTWHLNEVVEFMLKHYFIYFGSMLREIAWPMNEEDEQFLRDNDKEQYEAYLSGDYVPRVDVEASKVKFKSLDRPAKTFTVKSDSPSGGVFKFRLPQFGDILTLRTYLKAEFGDMDAAYKPIADALNEDEDAVPDDDRDAYLNYVAKKVDVSANANLALLLQEVDGRPVEGLEDALNTVLTDNRFDYNLSRKVKESADKFAEMFGVDPRVKMKNPVTGKTETRRLSFRLYDILQAIHLSKPDSYTVELDP